MRNTFYSTLAVGLLLFLSFNIYANSTTTCKPSVHIQPIKGNYISQLNGDVEKLEKFLLKLAGQNENYCKVSLRIDFKEGLETKQTITRGEKRYNEKLFLEVQYFSPLYEVIIENADGDILHKIELGQELRSFEYSNDKLKNHDALYAEWRGIKKDVFSEIEKDANNFQALIDFLKIENEMSGPENPSLVINEKKEILAPKGGFEKVEKKEKSTRKSRGKTRKRTNSKNKESKKLAKIKTHLVHKDRDVKVAKGMASKTKEANKELPEKIVIKTQPVHMESIAKIEKEIMSKPIVETIQTQEKQEIKTPLVHKDSEAKIEEKVSSKSKERENDKKVKVAVQSSSVHKESIAKIGNESEQKVGNVVMVKSELIEMPVKKKENKTTKSKANPRLKISSNEEENLSTKEQYFELEKYSSSKTSTEVAIKNQGESIESSEPKEIISDDDMFENIEVEEPLADLVQFQFPYGKNYMVINNSDFSIKINTGRESGKIFNDSSIKPQQEKKLKNKFKNGDWYSIVYPEKLHKKDVSNFKKSIESILSDLELSEFESDFLKMSEQLIPNLDIISSENPLADTTQKEKVENRFQKFINEKSIENFKEDQQKEAETELKDLLTLIVQSHRLNQYYKYTVGSSAAKRPVNKLPRFRKN